MHYYYYYYCYYYYIIIIIIERNILQTSNTVVGRNALLAQRCDFKFKIGALRKCFQDTHRIHTKRLQKGRHRNDGGQTKSGVRPVLPFCEGNLEGN